MNPFSGLNNFLPKISVNDLFGSIASADVDVFKGIDNPFNNKQNNGTLYYDDKSGKIQGNNGQGWANLNNVNEAADYFYGSGSGGGSGRSSGGGGGGAVARPDYSGQLAGLDMSERRLRDLLGQADTTLNQGLTQLEDSFRGETSKANQARTRALEDYDFQRQTTTNDKNAALGRVDTNARTLNDSLRRLLGLASGTGSSAFQFAAPDAVARQASQQRQGVMGDFADNFRNLDTAENRAKTDFEDLLNDLANQRRSRESDLRGGVEQQKQGIFSQLGDIASQRAAYRGGGTAAQIAAANPFMDQYNQSQASINSLFDRFRPNVVSREVAPQKVDLNKYTTDRAAINANRTMGGDEFSPYAQFLRRQREQ